MIEVAAAVLLRADGAFLLARRPAGKVYAGYWEFPGGKVEPGEDVRAALRRELREELGIEVVRATPWITRVFTYPHGTVRLSFFRVPAWEGEPTALEHEAIAWQRLDTPLAEPMLPANAPVISALRLPEVYAVTDAGRHGIDRMLALAEARMARGLRMLQVREPALDAASRDRLARELIALGRRYGCRILTKQLFPGADGVHVTAAQLMSLQERPAAALVGASCHTRPELERAMALGLDFAVAGPVCATASHPGAQLLGWEGFERLVAGTTIPVYAIGGLHLSDLERAREAGAHGLAMLTGAWV